MKVAAVVVWFNPAAKFVDNLVTYSIHVKKTIIVDNSPTDNSDLVNGNSDVEYIPLYENRGMAAALNIGIRRAASHGVEWILSMDQDSWFDDEAIRRFVNPGASHFKTKNVAVFAPSLFGSQGVEVVDCKSVITSGSLTKLSAHKKISGYNEQLFIDQVDHEYCFRLIRSKFRILRLEYIEMHHNLGKPISKKIFGFEIKSTNHDAVRKYYMTRNRIYMRKRYREFGTPYLKMVLIDIIKIILIERNKMIKLKSMFRGFIDGTCDRMGRLE